MSKPLGIYIHIPFCVRRCSYCAFYSNAAGEISGKDPVISEYFKALTKELDLRSRALGSSFFVDTVYFGGGTPSLADPSLISGVMDEIAGRFSLSSDAEISMEANPGTITNEKLKGYRDAGVNRLSIGLQSMDDGILKKLGRIHSAKDFLTGYDTARDAGFDNISVDLMFAVPGMSMEVWEDTVSRVTDLSPEHISLYSLQIEEGTPFYDAYKKGDLEQVTDEDDRVMYHRALGMMEDAGYRQYEISNVSLPGRECRHNMKYWTFSDYLGIGAGASSFVSGVRMTNDTDGYTSIMEGIGFEADLERLFTEHHENTEFDNMSEYMFTGLRLNRGIDKNDFRRRFGRLPEEAFKGSSEELAPFIKDGYIKEDADRIRLTGKGFDISNRIMQIFV